MFMNNRTYLVAVQILFIIKAISQYQYSLNFLFSVLATMDKHEKIEICDRCGKTPNGFKNIKIFHMHLKDNNGHSSKSYSCCYCGKSFQSRKNLNSHEKTIHKEDISYKCDECPKSFKRKDYLKTHKLTHEEAMGVSCRFCRKSFKTFRKENFNKHLESCKGKGFTMF